jgi:hypothetical protein
MKLLFSAALLLVLAPVLAHGQKGVDTQTQKIKEEANRTTTRTGEPSRSFDWGKGKTVVRERLPNPYRMSGRRDGIVQAVLEVLREKKMTVDDATSRLGEGVIITQPFVFAKGPVTTLNELRRYGVLDTGDTAWSRGQFTFTIEIQPIDATQVNVLVNAKVEGRAGTGLSSSWVMVQSSGMAEEEFLTKLVESVTGSAPEGIVQ